MKKISSYLKKIHFSDWSIPLALLAACVLAFGLLIPRLGFYHDDWTFVYQDAIRGTQGMVDLFNFDGHPLTVWLYILSFKLVGFNAQAWHIYALLWRWLAVTMFWILLDKMWPDQKRFSCVAALLFAIYPFFVLQILPISYFEVWVGYFLFFLSLYWMVQAVRQPQKFWVFSGLAIAAKMGQMFTSEYTWGIELIRPLIIWFALSEELSTQHKIRQTIKIFLPYLAIFLAAAIWRSLLFQAGRKEIAVQSTFFTHPLFALLSWLRFGLPDIGLILITCWYKVFDANYLDLYNRLNRFLLALILLCSIGIVLFLNKLPKPGSVDHLSKNPARQAILIGLAGLIFGLIPAYAAGYIVYLSAPPGNSRFALGAIPGAALFITGLLELLISSQQARNFLVAGLVSLSIGWHIRYTTDFIKLWENQVSFYRQLSWRAPGLKPATAVIVPDSIFSKTTYPTTILATSGEYPTAMALNIIYSTGAQTNETPYWFFLGISELIANPRADVNFRDSHLGSTFSGQSKDALVVLFTPGSHECLHLVRKSDANYRGYSDSLRLIAPFTSLDSIDTEVSEDKSVGSLNFRLLNVIIGKENQKTWCYFYQKADLAAQKMNWAEVTALWDEAKQKELAPTNGLELFPFIEAFLQLEEWDSALKLTNIADKLTPNMADVYCPLWKRQSDKKSMTAELEQALTNARDNLSCQRRRKQPPPPATLQDNMPGLRPTGQPD